MITASRKASCVSLLILAIMGGQPSCDAAVTNLTFLPVSCRKMTGGSMQNHTINIPLDGTPDYGTGTYYDPPDGSEVNCDDTKYKYYVFDIALNWSVTKPINGTNYTFTAADNDAYWDWYFTDYSGGSGNSCDYTKNCHGHAFGVGEWPLNDGAGILLSVGTCYEAVTTSNFDDAEIAVRVDYGHSLNVTGEKCTVPEVDEISAVTSTNEKFKESGVYTQSATCASGGVNVSKAHGVQSWVYYKKL